MNKVINKIKEPDFKNGDTLYNMFNYLCSRIDFSKVAFDNISIICMNTLFTELKKDDNKYIRWDLKL